MLCIEILKSTYDGFDLFFSDVVVNNNPLLCFWVRIEVSFYLFLQKQVIFKFLLRFFNSFITEFYEYHVCLWLSYQIYPFYLRQFIGQLLCYSMVIFQIFNHLFQRNKPHCSKHPWFPHKSSQHFFIYVEFFDKLLTANHHRADRTAKPLTQTKHNCCASRHQLFWVDLKFLASIKNSGSIQMNMQILLMTYFNKLSEVLKWVNRSDFRWIFYFEHIGSRGLIIFDFSDHFSYSLNWHQDIFICWNNSGQRSCQRCCRSLFIFDNMRFIREKNLAQRDSSSHEYTLISKTPTRHKRSCLLSHNRSSILLQLYNSRIFSIRMISNLCRQTHLSHFFCRMGHSI